MLLFLEAAGREEGEPEAPWLRQRWLVPRAVTAMPSGSSSTPTVESSKSTVTGSSAPPKTPRTYSRRPYCPRGARLAVSTAVRCGRGFTASPPLAPSTTCGTSPAVPGPPSRPGCPQPCTLCRPKNPSWLEPYPDALVDEVTPGPEARYEGRESIALSFVSALQRVPAQQRAVLVLRDVLGFPAAEAAEVLGTTTASVNHALLRARGTFRAPEDRDLVPLPRSAVERAVAERFVEAFESVDIDQVVSLLTEDARFAMPPEPIEFHGRSAVGEFVSSLPFWGRPLKLVATRANGQPAFGYYVLDQATSAFQGNGAPGRGLARRPGGPHHPIWGPGRAGPLRVAYGATTISLANSASRSVVPTSLSRQPPPRRLLPSAARPACWHAPPGTPTAVGEGGRAGAGPEPTTSSEPFGAGPRHHRRRGHRPCRCPRRQAPHQRDRGGRRLVRAHRRRRRSAKRQAPTVAGPSTFSVRRPMWRHPSQVRPRCQSWRRSADLVVRVVSK